MSGVVVKFVVKRFRSKILYNKKGLTKKTCKDEKIPWFHLTSRHVTAASTPPVTPTEKRFLTRVVSLI